MKFYAIANKDCLDCFYDFELNTYGDGICSHNLLPSQDFAEFTLLQSKLDDGKVIEVFITFDEEGILFEYDNIWR